jgi:microcystin-dependent protein
VVNPQTVNVGIIVPLTGADVDLWGQNDVNPNMVVIDGYIGGIQTVAVTNSPVTLTSPAGFTATPSPGPTEAQNRVLRFTGAMTGNVPVTLPLPGVYVIENLTTNNFILSFRGAVAATEVVAVDQGERQTIYNDGSNVRFVDLGGRVGQIEMWAGLTAMPAWVAACTKPPYLLCDGSVYNFSDYPYLGQRLLGKFGGNGITTFAVPDQSGRVALPYDKTGTRITVAGCGLNGQTIGATLDQQSVALTAAQLPSNIPYTDPGHTHGVSSVLGISSAGAIIPLGGSSNNTTFNYTVTTNTTNITINPAGGGAHPNVQPSIVTGIPVIRAF